MSSEDVKKEIEDKNEGLSFGCLLNRNSKGIMRKCSKGMY